jgi:DNA-binding SARP family transcriptional activator
VLGVARFAAEHRRCAEFFAARSHWESATGHYIAAGDDEAAAAVLARSGPDWIAAGKLAALVAFAERLPAAALAAHPRALVAQAEVARLRGDYDGAGALYRRSIPLLAAARDLEGEAEALHALATIARRRGDFGDAFAFLDRASSLADARSLVAAKCGNTRGLCLLQTGLVAEGERELRAALEVAEELGDEHHVRLIAHNLGGPSMVRGDFSEAIRWLRRMLASERPRPPVPQEATGHLNVARCLLYRGDLDACERHLALALERCQQFSLEGLMGEILESYGNLYRERLDVVRAADFYRRAVRAYNDAGVPLARREIREEQALLMLETGELGQAQASVERLIEDRQTTGDEMGVYTASLTRGRILIAGGEHREAVEGLEAAISFFRSHGFFYYEAQASLALAECARASGARKAMHERLGRALDLAARYDYEYWLRREVARNGALFAEPEARELLPADIAEVVPRQPTPPASPPVVVEPPAPAADLTIRLLGPVEVVRDPARPIPTDAWTTRRARDILCFVASRPGRRASKDVIIDTFWAETDFDAVEKNFHPTISHIRKALNRNQLIKQNFVIYRDGDYLLNPEFSYRIDVEEFERLHDEAEAARRTGDAELRVARIEEALALYRGEFLQGCYDEWAEEPRSYYAERRLMMLESLARIAEQRTDWPRALDLAHRILRLDAFREDIHCLAMRAHAAMGNRGAVREQYESLRALLDRELGVEPDPATARVYNELLGH